MQSIEHESQMWKGNVDTAFYNKLNTSFRSTVNYQKKIVLYNKLSWYVSELPKKKYLKHGGPVLVALYNKQSCYVSELPEKDISNVVV